MRRGIDMGLMGRRKTPMANGVRILLIMIMGLEFIIRVLGSF